MLNRQQSTNKQPGIRWSFQVHVTLKPGHTLGDAIAAGHSAICTIDRDGAEENRKESLKGYPTKKGYDRDEWPMAMCAEGGAGADIRYITPSDNREAGSWVSHRLENFADGTKVKFIVNQLCIIKT